MEKVQEKIFSIERHEQEDRLSRSERGQFYLATKSSHGPEQYLFDDDTTRDGRQWKWKMRSSSAPLENIHKREARGSSSNGECKLCDSGAQEDQVHIMCVCPQYNQQRLLLEETVMKTQIITEEMWKEATLEQRTTWLLGECDVVVDNAVKLYLKHVFKHRQSLLSQPHRIYPYHSHVFASSATAAATAATATTTTATPKVSRKRAARARDAATATATAAAAAAAVVEGGSGDEEEVIEEKSDDEEWVGDGEGRGPTTATVIIVDDVV
jgi:hypothetical protein